MSSFEEEFDEEDDEDEKKLIKKSNELEENKNEIKITPEENDLQFQLRFEAEENSQKNVKTRIDPDGTISEWDETRRAWIPKIDENFLANYNLSYGVDEDAALIRKRTEEWTAYFEQQKNCQNSQQKTELTPEEQQQMNEYYQSDAYREWYQSYINACSAASTTVADSIPGPSSQSSDQPQPASSDPKPPESTPSTSTCSRKRSREPRKPADTWFELADTNNTHVYVTGLPPDCGDEEFEQLMSKCGLIANEPFSTKKRIKVYRDAETGQPKGDARCCYIRVESVDLALKLIDGAELRGHRLTCDRARFQKKADFDPKWRRRLTDKEKKKLKEHQDKLFRWGLETDRFVRPKKDRVLIFKNVFSVDRIMEVPTLIDDIRHALMAELSASACGVVNKLLVYENNPEGVVRVDFQTAEEADVALGYTDGRVLANSGRFHVSGVDATLAVSVWDGKTHFDVAESEEMREERLQRWQRFIQGEEAAKNDPL